MLIIYEFDPLGVEGSSREPRRVMSSEVIQRGRLKPYRLATMQGCVNRVDARDWQPVALRIEIGHETVIGVEFPVVDDTARRQGVLETLCECDGSVGVDIGTRNNPKSKV